MKVRSWAGSAKNGFPDLAGAAGGALGNDLLPKKACASLAASSSVMEGSLFLRACALAFTL